MLRSAEGLKRNKIVARDGELGHVQDLLFDDERWALRYVVVDTSWLAGRRVLISPLSVERADGDLREVRVDLTMDQIERSPSIDADAPVHRQQEMKLADHYQYPYYWGWGGLWGAYGAPSALRAAGRGFQPGRRAESAEEGDPHLRSVREVTGYHIAATDGEIGHVEDVLFDSESWAIRYLVIDTRSWWFGRKVLVSPAWADEIRWADRSVRVSVTRDQVRSAPEWHPTALVNREFEARLYDAYGRPGYWEEDEARARGSGPHAVF